jgi:cytochrome c
MTEAELAFWDTSILVDGSNLPAGSGSSAQGAAIYVQKCAACHGPTGAETITRLTPLIGGKGSLATEQPVKTLGSYWPHATIVFDYIRRAMPYNAPKTLSNDEVYALTAYLLQANGIIDQAVVLDRTSLPAVKMPNRDGFVNAWERSD